MIVCHLSSVHKPYDVRIFLKECRSLAAAGHTVHYVVPSEKTGSEVRDGVTIHFVKKPTGRKERFLQTGRLVVEAGLKTGAAIFHLHDPELLVWVNKLKKLGKKVIYDAHEDLPRQIVGKPWIAKPIRTVVANLSEIGEDRYAKRADAIVTATPHIAERFIKINPNTINVNNYPLADEYNNALTGIPYMQRDYIAYIGGITRIRGIVELVKAMHQVDCKLVLAGDFESEALLEECKALSGWQKIDYRGFVSREQSAEILSGALAGLVTFYPMPNHTEALPNKMFEYAAAGVPVIASDFEYWQKLMREWRFGLNVNALEPGSIADGINKLLDNRELAAELGNNGRLAVTTHFNWNNEEKKLVALYAGLE